MATLPSNKKILDRLRFHVERKFRHRLKHYRKVIRSDSFAKRYAVCAVVVLLGTTILWSILGAGLQRGNADQIVNPYLFNDWQTLHGSLLPGAHSLLLKWPLFWLLPAVGVSGFTLAALTVLVCLLTVGGLAYLIYKIEPRPLYFGTICLALASVLLLVPTQPYAGGLLPVNMAMIATRNLEYLLYIAGLILLIRAPSFKTRQFWLAIASFSLLIASDRLFLIIGLFGALFVALASYFTRQKDLMSLGRNWLLSTMGGWLGSIGLLWIAGRALVHISSKTAAVPYGLIHSLHDLALGSLYGFLGFLTNLGANPAFDATLIKNIPSSLYHHLTGEGGPAYIINIAVTALGIYFSIKFLGWTAGLKNTKRDRSKLDTPAKLSLMLLTSTAGTLGAFVISHHYWAVDARYLAIGLFAIFVAGASYLRKRKLAPEYLLLAGGVLIFGMVLGTSQLIKIYNGQKSGLAAINDRNALVSAVLSHHKVDVLVGDYWRVLPIKLSSPADLKVMPLDGCTHARTVLSSQAWQPDLKHQKFAYLLSLDRSLTNYPSCSLDQVFSTYGRPNTSTLIAGSLANPTELLLFYDNGIRQSSPQIILKTPSTVLPIPLNQLPNVNCIGQTIMNTAAHQDDDLLFMTPDLLHDLHGGKCVRTVYLTAGDAGSDQYYWLNREQGSEAAYSKMIGYDGIWVKRIIRLGNNQYIRVDNPRGNSKVSLIFMRLPDGNVKGQGFRTTNYESLEKLETGKIGSMHSVDRQSEYSYVQLRSALLELMRTYGPAEIHTQATLVDQRYPDHSDHIAVSRLTHQVWQQYDSRVPIKYYIGYPSYGRPSNVFGADLQQSEDAFFAYAKFDPGVCGSEITCQKSKASYGAYLHTQYTSPE